MTTLFEKISRQEFVRWRKTCSQYLWKPKLSSNEGTFLSKLIQSVQFEYFNGLLPCPQRSYSVLVMTHLGVGWRLWSYPWGLFPHPRTGLHPRTTPCAYPYPGAHADALGAALEPTFALRFDALGLAFGGCSGLPLAPHWGRPWCFLPFLWVQLAAWWSISSIQWLVVGLRYESLPEPSEATKSKTLTYLQDHTLVSLSSASQTFNGFLLEIKSLMVGDRMTGMLRICNVTLKWM